MNALEVFCLAPGAARPPRRDSCTVTGARHSCVVPLASYKNYYLLYLTTGVEELIPNLNMTPCNRVYRDSLTPISSLLIRYNTNNTMTLTIKL